MQPPNQRGQCARHPERVADTVCPRCGNFTCPECNPDGVSRCPSCLALGDNAVQTQPTDWERRSELGFAQGFFQTWKKSLLEPKTFWPSVQPDGPALDAFLYGWLITAVASIAQIPFTWLNASQLVESMQKLGEASEQFHDVAKIFTQMASTGLIFALGTAVFGIAVYPLSLVMGAALTYLGGLMFGAADKGFNATLRALAYANGPSILAFIPVVGGLAGLWTLVLEIWAVKEMQKTSTGRAIGAVLWWTVLLCCCLGLGAAVIGVAMAKNFK
jgi:hypothetical protein